MTVSLRDARNHPRDLEWIESVYRDYLDDLGLLNTGIFPALGEIGHREPDHLQRWLVDRSATLLTILDEGQPAGFAMVARQTHASREAEYRMAEFFVVRGARRRLRCRCRFGTRWRPGAEVVARGGSGWARERGRL